MEIESHSERTSPFAIYTKHSIEVGKAALELAVENEDLFSIRRYSAGSIPVATARLLWKVSHIAMGIETVSRESLTSRGVARFMLHNNKLLQGHTPLEVCAVGEGKLAVETGKCFYDPEYVGDLDREEFDRSLDHAVTELQRIYA